MSALERAQEILAKPRAFVKAQVLEALADLAQACADEDRTCVRCGDVVSVLNSRDECLGCEEERDQTDDPWLPPPVLVTPASLPIIDRPPLGGWPNKHSDEL